MRFHVFAALIFVVAAMAAQPIFAQGASWDYRGKQGPLNWGKLDPANRACSQGREQSPVDIRGARLDKNLAPLQFHFIAGPVTLVNDGRTISMQVYPGSTMVADGVTYELKSLAFHHPGENAVKGKLTDMDAELLFQSTDGKMAVVATRMLLDWGAPNATIAELWEHLPAKTGASEKITDMVNPGGLLPEDPGYWTFMGSLTTPPCTEGVRWFVYETPITISGAQLGAYTEIFRMDSRPLQDTHGRKIAANE